MKMLLMWILGAVLGGVFVITACLAIFLPLRLWGVYDIADGDFRHTWPIIISYFFFLMIWGYFWNKYIIKQKKE